MLLGVSAPWQFNSVGLLAKSLRLSRFLVSGASCRVISLIRSSLRSGLIRRRRLFERRIEAGRFGFAYAATGDRAARNVEFRLRFSRTNVGRISGCATFERTGADSGCGETDARGHGSGRDCWKRRRLRGGSNALRRRVAILITTSRGVAIAADGRGFISRRVVSTTMPCKVCSIFCRMSGSRRRWMNAGG